MTLSYLSELEPQSIRKSLNVLMANIKVTTPTECWVWQNGTMKDGRGQIYVQKQSVPAPRLVFILFNGDLAKTEEHHGTVVRHTCDNPACCNPSHLISGTQKDNIRDMYERLRKPRAVRHHNAKLNENDIPLIRADDRSTSAIAKDFGVTASVVSNIKTYRSWRHVPPAPTDKPIHLHQRRGQAGPKTER